MTWRRGEAGSTLIDRPKDAPVPDFTNGMQGKGYRAARYSIATTVSVLVCSLMQNEGIRNIKKSKLNSPTKSAANL